MSEEKTLTVTEKELEQLVERVTRRVLHDIGVDATDTFELRRDFTFVREWRQGSEMVRGKITLTIVTTLVAGAIASLWLGVRQLLSS